MNNIGFRIFVFPMVIIIGITALLCGCTTAQKSEGSPNYIEISPSNAITEVGSSQQFTAIVRDTNGNAMSTPVTFSLSPESIGVIDNTGLFTAAKNGQGIIEVRTDTLYGYVNIAVTSNGILSVNITGYSINDFYAFDSEPLYVNDVVQFNVTCRDGNNNYILNIDPNLITWSFNPAIAETISSGTCHIIKDGTLTVTASYKGVEGSTSFDIPRIIRLTAEADTEVGYRISDGLRLGPWPDSLGGGYSTEYGYYWYGFIKYHFPSSLTMPTFTSAKMKIYGKALWNSAPVGWVDIYENTSNWEESTLTYDNMPPKGDLIATPEFDTQNSYKWYEIDVAGIVRKWISGEKNNYGFRIENTRCSESNSIAITPRNLPNYPRILIYY